jgi:thiol-disulfide isomerase/thioredoxin
MAMPSIKLILVTVISIAILAFLGVLVSGGGFSQKSGFADLGQKTNTFTLYYMNGCPHCESILPAYKQFAAAGQFASDGKKTKIRMLEQGDPNAGPELEAHNVTGFPTFVLSTATGQDLEYKGERTVPAISEFIKKNAA